MQRQRRLFFLSLLLLAAALPLFHVSSARAQGAGDQVVYTDALQNGWQNYGWATLNYNNPSPVRSGSASISVSAAAYEALYLHHNAQDTSGFTDLIFWIHGGAAGGQRLQVQGLLNGTAQTAVALGPLAANTWQQVTIALSALGVANKTNFDGFWIKDTTGAAQPTWYVDDVRLVGVPPPSAANVSVNAGDVIRVVDNRLFGLNTAIYDSAFNTPETVSLLQAMDNKVLRFPGGSLSDEYHWATNTTQNNTWTWATGFDAFANVARQTNAQAFITVNYGSGTPQEAADWVRNANVTRALGIKYWEIGNENYGSWEFDTRARPHDPYTYANAAKDYIAQMKAVDPAIKIGVVVTSGEDDYANYSDHPVVNPRTGQTHNGWTPVVLATLKSLNVTPDFVIYHKYAQGPGSENDASLLQSARSWASDVANLRQMVSDYLGTAGASVEIVCTENNSVYSSPGKQTTSLVNGLFLADSIGQALQTELSTLIWWDLRNSQDGANNNGASLYGWRAYGDYGVVSGANDRYPTYFVSRLLQWWARGGDQVVRATSDYNLLSVYAAKRTDGTLTLLVINKSPGAALSANVSLSGFTPAASATVRSYGVPQDEAARTGSGSPDVAQSTFSGAGTTFAYNFPAYSVTVLTLSPASAPPPAPPAAPSGLAATAASKSQINLSWTDNAANETGFKIERSADNVTFTQIGTTGANATSYADTGRAANTLYYYRVRAYNTAGNSAYSNTASARTPRK